MKNTTPWILWLIITMVSLLSTRNPVYLLIMLIGLLFSGALLAKKKHQSQWLTQNFRFILTMVLISTVINMLFTHTGRTILFTLPENWLLVGGSITLESLVYGAINGLVIGTIYLVFNLINLALSVKQLTQLIPSVFHPIAMMVTISLTFFPSIQQRAQEIKEAQMIRGNPMKKVSDWLPLMIPLLVTSLESAILLSESMTTRSFHSRQSSKTSDLTIIGLISASFAVFAGWILRLYDYPGILSILLYLFGGLLIALILFITSRRTKITRYQKENWQRSDILATILLSSFMVGIIILRLTDQMPILSYSTYPSLSWPELHFFGLFMSLIPILPTVFTSDD